MVRKMMLNIFISSFAFLAIVQAEADSSKRARYQAVVEKQEAQQKQEKEQAQRQKIKSDNEVFLKKGLRKNQYLIESQKNELIQHLESKYGPDTSFRDQNIRDDMLRFRDILNNQSLNQEQKKKVIDQYFTTKMKEDNKKKNEEKTKKEKKEDNLQKDIKLKEETKGVQNKNDDKMQNKTNLPKAPYHY